MASPHLAASSLLAFAALAGCGQEPFPEVSKDNCTFQRMMQIKDHARRVDFQSFCSHIPKTAWPIHPDKWLVLSEDERREFEQAELRKHTTPNPLDWFSIKP